MSSFLQLSIAIAVILFSAKLAGLLSTRLGQPSVFGELVVGLLLGPSLIDLVHLPFMTDAHLGELVHELAELGVLLLMFMAGLEMHLSELARNTRVAAYGGILGVITPVVLGFGAGLLSGMPAGQALFLGLALGATSVSISAQTLMELNVLRSRVGLGLLGAAVFDDIIVILLLSVTTALLGGENTGLGQILLILLRMILFLALSMAFGLRILPRITRSVSRLPVSQGMVTLALVILLVYGVAAELIGGVAAITGAFIAGLMFGRTGKNTQVESGIHAISYGLFVPIFFVNIGLQINVRTLDAGALWLMLVISVIGILGKILGSGAGARLGGFSWLESIQLGIGMVSRGEVGLIVASVGLTAGLLIESVFSAVVGMVLVTTLVTPPMLRASLKHKGRHATHEIRQSEIEQEKS